MSGGGGDKKTFRYRLLYRGRDSSCLWLYPVSLDSYSTEHDTYPESLKKVSPLLQAAEGDGELTYKIFLSLPIAQAVVLEERQTFSSIFFTKKYSVHLCF